MSKKISITDEEAIAFHAEGRAGKLAVTATKPLVTQRDLSLGYSPGVAVPCLKIAKDPDSAYELTAKGNFVAVISNGTAVLGLGNLGALASKPVMEGKAILFKRFADIDGIDIEVDTTDVDEFVNAVKYLGPSWGGINLEDIAAPECFIIEQRLKEEMDIPIFHDDQHGTAIITAAGLINACDITGRKFSDLKVVVNGAGSAGIACLELIKNMGVPHDNILLCDRTGVVYQGREESMNQWKSAHAVATDRRSLKDALEGADVFLGLSVKDAVSQDMVKGMAENPIIFAMANPDPEIRPEKVKEVRPDAIIATGRSDYPNQVNNVMGFPYIFRGALDVHATEINEEMKIACANALAQLAREEVPEEVAIAYSGRKMRYGPEYIIPTPFDPRLIENIPLAVAEAAINSGVARKKVLDKYSYRMELRGRLDPTANSMNLLFDMVKANPKKMIFGEGEEESVIRAAITWRDNGYGQPILVGRENIIEKKMDRMGIENRDNIIISNAANNPDIDEYIAFLYTKLQRKGYLHRDIVRMVKNERNIYAACMLQRGFGDALITGLTRNYRTTFEDIALVIDEKKNKRVFGMSILLSEGKTVYMGDTTICELPSPKELADIAEQMAEKAQHMGHTPRVALLSFSNFGQPQLEKAARIQEAVEILDSRKVSFEYDGEMAADVALNKDLLELYPFCRLTKPANILIMPALHTANIASKLLQELGGGTLIGPALVGMDKPVQIVQMGSTVNEILALAAMAAVDAIKS